MLKPFIHAILLRNSAKNKHLTRTHMETLAPSLQINVPKMPSTSPFKRILQGAVKGADFDLRSSSLLPDEDIVYFCCILPFYCRQQIYCTLPCSNRAAKPRKRKPFFHSWTYHRLAVGNLREVFHMAVQSGSHSSKFNGVPSLWPL